MQSFGASVSMVEQGAAYHGKVHSQQSSLQAQVEVRRATNALLTGPFGLLVRVFQLWKGLQVAARRRQPILSRQKQIQPPYGIVYIEAMRHRLTHMLKRLSRVLSFLRELLLVRLCLRRRCRRFGAMNPVEAHGGGSYTSVGRKHLYIEG